MRGKRRRERLASEPTRTSNASPEKETPNTECFEAKRKKRAILRKKMRLEQQTLQPQGTSYWTEHKGQGQTMPTERVYPEGFKGQMYPAGAAANSRQQLFFDNGQQKDARSTRACHGRTNKSRLLLSEVHICRP